MGPRESQGRSDATPARQLAGIAPATALFPLRLFLGVTFAYAGVQKLGDPGFLRPGAPTYVGTQLQAFANGTPGGFLLRAFALPHPTLAGVAVALVEIAVGLTVLAGLATRTAATVGLLLSSVLFLTNGWKTYPYFLNSDIILMFAWLPFVLAGATGQPALDNAVDRLRDAPKAQGRPAPAGASRTAHPNDPALTRRALLTRLLGMASAATFALGGVTVLLRGAYRSRARVLSASTTQPSTDAPARAAEPLTGRRKLPAGAVRLGPSNQLPPGQSATYADPGDGQPDILIRQGDGTLTAFSAVCTHAGCTVGFAGNGQIVCPCHGGSFNARTGAVEAGPPPTPLPTKRVLEQGGQIYALPA